MGSRPTLLAAPSLPRSVLERCDLTVDDGEQVWIYKGKGKAEDGSQG